jgi:hypothetical protein
MTSHPSGNGPPVLFQPDVPVHGPVVAQPLSPLSGAPAGADDGDGPCGPPGRIWARVEYLLWWTKGSPLPPLLTISAPGTPLTLAGIVGTPGTAVLFGDTSGDNGPRSGGRFTIGGWLNEDQSTGIEGNFFFLESLHNHYFAASSGQQILGRPFFDTRHGEPNSLLISFPGLVQGSFSATTSSDFYGAEANLRQNLCCGCCYRVDLLGGFRYLHLREDLNIAETEISLDEALAPVGTRFDIAEGFGTKNDFYGGQIGVEAEFRCERLYAQVLGKVALGGTNQVVSINGVTTENGVVLGQGGFLALLTNIGRFHHTAFSVVPEAGVTLGYQVTDNLRAFVGYTFLYWSDVVRPGQQVSLLINPTQFPPGTLAGTPAPAFSRQDTDFWAQGVNFGAELRF